MAYDEDFEDEAATQDEGESESTGGISSKGDNLRGKALDAAIKKDWGKTDKMDVSAVEEAVTSQKRKAGHPYPYESGFGRSGRRWADVERYDAEARKNGTSLSGTTTPASKTLGGNMGQPPRSNSSRQRWGRIR